jgi:PAS domain S-box-containing protein
VEQALRESEQRYATMFHRSPLAMAWAHLPEATLADVNDAWVKLTGVPRGEAIGRTADELGLVDPEDRRRLYDEMLAHGSAQRGCGSSPGRAASARSRRAARGARRERYPRRPQDITDRKLAEDALRTADRRKDEFLAMLSHELRNPLAPIRNSITSCVTPSRAATRPAARRT